MCERCSHKRQCGIENANDMDAVEHERRLAMQKASLLPDRTRALVEQNALPQFMRDLRAFTAAASAEDENHFFVRGPDPLPSGASYTGDPEAVRVIREYFCAKADAERDGRCTQEDWDYLRSRDEVSRVDRDVHVTSWAFFEALWKTATDPPRDQDQEE